MDETTPVIDPKPVVIPDLDQLPRASASPSRLQDDKEDAEREMAMFPGQWTPAKIRHWRGLGIQRPDWISLADWKQADESIKPLQRIVCYLAAIGMDNKDIAKSTGKSEGFVRQVVNSGAGEAEIERIQDKVWGKTFKQTIEEIVPIAIQTALKAMLDPGTKASTKVAAAFAFMDRAMGKPTQTVEVQNNMLREVFQMLDAQGARQPIDVASESQERPALTEPESVATVKVERTPKDPIDSWVEENL